MRSISRRSLLGGVASLLAAPLAAQAQPAGKVYRIGILRPESRRGRRSRNSTPTRSQRTGSLGFGPKDAEPYLTVIESGLRQLGHAPGRNFVIEARLANGERQRLPDLARQLVDARVDVIVAVTNPDIAAAKQTTNTIPIVMVLGLDPVFSGFAASFSRPGSNITGTTYDVTPDMASKWVELLKQLVPDARRFAILWDPAFPGIKPWTEAAKTAATRLGVRTRTVASASGDELPPVLASLTRQKDDAVVVLGSSVFFNRRADIVAALNGTHLPAIYVIRSMVEAGGLMSYGVDITTLWARVPVFIDKIFRGAKPADLPIEQPTKFELVINLKTAKALGLTIPQSLLLRADQVLE